MRSEEIPSHRAAVQFYFQQATDNDPLSCGFSVGCDPAVIRFHLVSGSVVIRFHLVSGSVSLVFIRCLSLVVIHQLLSASPSGANEVTFIAMLNFMMFRNKTQN